MFKELPVVNKKPERAKKPDWLRVKLPIGENYKKVRQLVDKYKLHTIIEEHTELEYDDVTDALRVTDSDPNNPNNQTAPIVLQRMRE